jgi:hypothetical protein
MQDGRSIPFLEKNTAGTTAGYVTFLRDILARQLNILRALCDAIPAAKNNAGRIFRRKI